MEKAVKPKLLDQVREKIRVKDCSIRTEKAWVGKSAHGPWRLSKTLALTLHCQQGT